MHSIAEWTILVFLNAKNNLEEFAFPNFKQMASIGSTPEVNIVVEMGRPKRHYSDLFGAWSKTLRFHVSQGTKPTEADAIADLGATNMGDASTLTDFVAWGRANFPAKRTLLVIWNHGQGWRAPEEDGKPPPPPPVPPHAGHRYVSNDDDTGDKLYNRAIQDSLTALLGDERIDVIAFDACLMAMVETAYALRGVARVMVGSEELEPGTGWNYTRWLAPLVAAKGAMEAADLGRLMVKGMEEEYGDLDATTLSATELDRAELLAAAISTFAEAAMPQLDDHLAAFQASRAACKNYAPGHDLHSIDLGHYMEQIVKGPFPEGLRASARDVLSRLEGAIVANYASKLRQGKFGSKGLGIYYPASGKAHARDPDGEGYAKDNEHFPVEFVQNHKWAEFLRQYWRMVP